MKGVNTLTLRWRSAFLILALILVMMSVLVPTALAFNENNVEKKPSVEPAVVLDARFDWVPNPASVNEVVVGATQIRYQSWFYIVAIRYIVKVDGRLAKPVIISTNLPYKQFVKEDGWWVYDSGCFVEIAPPGAIITKYLDFKTSASKPGNYIGIVRHPSLAEDPICGANSGLSATAILIVK